MEDGALVRCLTALEDIEAIKRLKAEYCDICDDDHNQERIVKIFTSDGIWESKGVGRAEGHAELRKLFQSFQERISFSQHNVFNPRIEVDGDRARGIWYFMGPFTFRKTSQAVWLAARYEEDYVKLGGAWRFKHLRAIGRMAAPYEAGWATKSRLNPFR
jgi:hypothetical protein